LLNALKKAGLVGITFHVDSKQGRPGWKNKSEVELNALRLELAQRVADVGGISCAFNSTVYEDTLDSVPDLMRFAEEHYGLIHTMVFILYRAADQDGRFDYFAGSKKVEDLGALVYANDPAGRIDLQASHVVAKIRERFPDFTPAAYLGGTEKPDSFKWLISGRVGRSGKTYGYVGPRFMEMVQEGHHAATGRYLAYTRPGAMKLGPLHYQSILIIQPIDLMEDGRQNMCDGCPDTTVHNGELVWSCRLEERLKYGQMLRCAPRPASACATRMG
jgi:hypothetical protein